MIAAFLQMLQSRKEEVIQVSEVLTAQQESCGEVTNSFLLQLIEGMHNLNPYLFNIRRVLGGYRYLWNFDPYFGKDQLNDIQRMLLEYSNIIVKHAKDSEHLLNLVASRVLNLLEQVRNHLAHQRLSISTHDCNHPVDIVSDLVLQSRDLMQARNLEEHNDLAEDLVEVLLLAWSLNLVMIALGHLYEEL